MNFLHYKWANNVELSGSMYIGEPARRSFDPFNGDQVLFIINYYASIFGELTLKAGRLIEGKIAYELPIELKSERSVFNWIRDLRITEADNISEKKGQY